MSLVWREQLSVGNDVIDSDHKYLIELINRIEASLVSKDRKELMSGLDSLLKYAQTHFVREIRIARAVGYSQVLQLDQSHASLLSHLEQTKTEIGNAGQELSPTAIEHFTQLLRSWLIDHVIKEDLLMRPTLQKHSPKYDPP